MVSFLNKGMSVYVNLHNVFTCVVLSFPRDLPRIYIGGEDTDCVCHACLTLGACFWAHAISSTLVHAGVRIVTVLCHVEHAEKKVYTLCIN